MLYLAVPRLLTSHPETVKRELFSRCCEFLRFVMERHFDAATERFGEFIHRGTGALLDTLDPGHCTEFVGLGFSAIFAMSRELRLCPPEAAELFAQARRMLPRIFLSAFRRGFHAKHAGMFKAVNGRTGEILDSTMPWWNLPETMRAGYFAALSTPDEALRRQCLEAAAKCHAAYFGHYLNPNLMGFPYQTRSGLTGEVLDAALAIPEGDPLYHANLAFLEIIRHAEGSRSVGI